MGKNIFTDIFKLKEEDKKILAVGTTVCRTLESIPHLWKALSKSQKDIFPEQVQEFWNTITRSINEETSCISDIS